MLSILKEEFPSNLYEDCIDLRALVSKVNQQQTTNIYEDFIVDEYIGMEDTHVDIGGSKISTLIKTKCNFKTLERVFSKSKISYNLDESCLHKYSDDYHCKYNQCSDCKYMCKLIIYLAKHKVQPQDIKPLFKLAVDYGLVEAVAEILKRYLNLPIVDFFGFNDNVDILLFEAMTYHEKELVYRIKALAMYRCLVNFPYLLDTYKEHKWSLAGMAISKFCMAKSFSLLGESLRLPLTIDSRREFNEVLEAIKELPSELNRQWYEKIIKVGNGYKTEEDDSN